MTGTLVSSVLPASDGLAYSEVYSDPPGLAPLPEEEPLIARSVAKRRNEFITVRHCARIALGELGLPPAPILKGEKENPAGPTAWWAVSPIARAIAGRWWAAPARCARWASTPNRTTCCPTGC